MIASFYSRRCGVIWCNSLGDSHFQTYVMNFVEIVIDFYSYITSHVSQVFASCTHYTKLLFAKLCTCYYVWFWFGHPRLKIPWVKCKMCLKFENLRRIDWKSYFWENWVQNKCFWKPFHLILMHFIHKTLCFEEFLHKIALFFKKLFFTCSSLFQNFSNTILSLFDWSRSQSKFLSFSPNSFARFLSSKASKTFIPLLFHLFSCFMHIFHALWENFEPMKFWVFLLI